MDKSLSSSYNIQLQSLISSLQLTSKTLSSLVVQRTKYSTQLTENEMVQEELQEMKKSSGGDPKVYKLVGPILLLQDFSDALGNVSNRIKYFQNEILRIEKLQKSEETKRTEIQKNIQNLQQQAKAIQQEAVQKQLQLQQGQGKGQTK